jgi:ABC-2 type transport system ATP-binding protein
MESVEQMCDEIALINKAKLVLSGNVERIRREYGNNRVEVLYKPLNNSPQQEATLQQSQLATTLPQSDHYKIVSCEEVKEGVRAILELADGVSNNAVLSELMNKCQIVAYQELMPKMNEIFIKLVEGGKENE